MGAPGVETTPGDARPVTHERDREAGPLRLDEPEQLHRIGSVSLAKKAAAFPRKSRVPQSGGRLHCHSVAQAFEAADRSSERGLPVSFIK